MNHTLSAFQLLAVYFKHPEQIPFLLHISIKKIILTIFIYFCCLTMILGVLASIYGWFLGDMLRSQLPAGARFYFEESAKELRAEHVTLPLELQLPLSGKLRIESSNVQFSRNNQSPMRLAYSEFLSAGQQVDLDLNSLQSDWKKSFAITMATITPFFTSALFISHLFQVIFYGIMLSFLLPLLRIRMDLLHVMRFAFLLFIPSETIALTASLIHLQLDQWVFDVAFWSLAMYYVWLFKRLVRNAQVV